MAIKCRSPSMRFLRVAFALTLVHLFNFSLWSTKVRASLGMTKWLKDIWPLELLRFEIFAEDGRWLFILHACMHVCMLIWLVSRSNNFSFFFCLFDIFPHQYQVSMNIQVLNVSVLSPLDVLKIHWLVFVLTRIQAASSLCSVYCSNVPLCHE